jgi:hypothetical protein
VLLLLVQVDGVGGREGKTDACFIAAELLVHSIHLRLASTLPLPALRSFSAAISW